MAQSTDASRLGSFGKGSLFSRGGGGALRRLIGIAAAAVVAIGGPALAQGQALEELRSRYPAVKTHDPHGRALTVWGAPMTRGETPREAAEEWVFWYGAVFGSELDLEEFREVTLRNAPKGKERRVFMYRQQMGELPVVGSSFRVMTEGEPEGGPAEVVYVAGRVAIRPAGGLAEPRVTPAEALAAAKAHERARGLEVWGEPELVAIYDDAPRGDGVAYPAWRVTAAGGPERDSWNFYIDAVTGIVVRDHSNDMHFAGEIQGTVSGNATPGLRPDIPVFTAPGSIFYGCSNLPNSANLPDVRVEAYDANGLLVDTGWTDENGNFELDIHANAFPVSVFAELKGPDVLQGPGWFVLDGSSDEWGDEIPALAHVGNPITAPASGVNLQFNPAPTEKTTAMVNAHLHMSKTWRWLDLGNLTVDPLPTAPVIVHHDGGECAAKFMLPNVDNPWPQGALRFNQSSFGTTPACVNAAFSMIVAHEYGHFVLYHLGGIAVSNEAEKALHEGFADSLSLLVYNTEVYGEDWMGCDTIQRYPRDPGPPAIEHTYPLCPGDPCSGYFGHLAGPHCQGELLSSLWLDMRDALGGAATQELFLDWIMVAQPAGDAFCALVGRDLDQSADESTLLSVLSVADDADWPTICDVFDGRQIVYTGPAPDPCADSAGGLCYADCDSSGVLNFQDFLCFQSTFVGGDSYADCDGDAELSVYDYLCFQNEFVRGCF